MVGKLVFGTEFEARIGVNFLINIGAKRMHYAKYDIYFRPTLTRPPSKPGRFWAR